MLTRTSEYALRALVHMARHEEEWPLPGNRIAADTGVPAKYLSKILGDLVRTGVLTSSRGKSGGFRMAKPADQTTLHAVLSPFERFVTTRCMFGNPNCTPSNPCLAHEDWVTVLDGMDAFFKSKTVHDVAYQRRELQKTGAAKRGSSGRKRTSARGRRKAS